jgi:hypothetical protein
MHGFPQSLLLRLPPLSALVFAPIADVSAKAAPKAKPKRRAVPKVKAAKKAESKKSARAPKAG